MNNRDKKIKIVGLNARFTHSCLALFYVRNELEKNCPDYHRQLLQFTINDNYYEMLLRLSRGNPGYIFFSAAIWNSSLVEKLTLDLRICLPDCRVVIGGPQASVLGERLGADICTIVFGEIEGIEKNFYRDLEAGCLRPRYSASFFAMKERRFDYPYREADFTDHLKNRHIYFESSRGCPFSCTYCLSAGEKGLYHKELKAVETELRDILSHRPKVIRFIDRTFNDVPDRALAIWTFLAAEGGETLFHFEMAPDRFTEEMFDFLGTIEPGRFQFELGIQSTHDKTLEAVNRRVDPLETRQTISRLARLGNIHLHVDLILGLPYETRDSFAASFRDVFAMGAHYIQMGLLKILPDTPICHGADEFGYAHCSEPPYSILRTRWMDHPTIRNLYWFSELVEKFHNNRYFVSLWRYLRKNGVDVYQFFQDLLLLCQAGGFFQLAATQELMSTKLVELFARREDRDLVVELLRYDWLRCGFRFLPTCLKVDSSREQPEETKSGLYQSLPAEFDGVYSRSSRNQFFRKSYFLRISKDACNEIGLSTNAVRPCLCILQERELTVSAYNKIMIL
ncbi:MAG: DUF4080 domain-containing protein [Desulforhopalus sp.]